jgi:hypothetical protein
MKHFRLKAIRKNGKINVKTGGLEYWNVGKTKPKIISLTELAEYPEKNKSFFNLQQTTHNSHGLLQAVFY